MAGVVERLTQRVWGPRAGLDGLGAHLEGRHGISVSKLTALDNGVMRVDRADGPPWVARVFPADRPVAAVDGDAAVLAYLADLGLPAERLAAAEPVSELSGQGVLVTRFVDGGDPGGGERTNRALVDLAGRLHALPPGPPATQREAGSLHLYTAEGGIRAELDTLAGLLDAVAGQVSSGEKALYEALVAEVACAPDFADLPHALIHTDLVHSNVIDAGGELVPIDWTGTGRGPRVVSFAVPLFYGGQAPGGWSPANVDALAQAYRDHVRLEAGELDLLGPAIAHRSLLDACIGLALAVTAGRPVQSLADWQGTRALADDMAAHARRALAARG